MPVTMPVRSPSVYEQGIGGMVLHRVAGILDGRGPVDEYGLFPACILDACPEHRVQALRALSRRRKHRAGAKDRNRKKPRKPGSSLQVEGSSLLAAENRVSPRWRRSLRLPSRAQRNLSRKCLSGRASPRLLRAPFLDSAFYDDVEEVGTLAHLHDRRAGREIADVHGGTQCFHFRRSQPVEWRILSVEALHRSCRKRLGWRRENSRLLKP